MKSTAISLLVSVVALVTLASTSQAQPVTSGEALSVCQNWIRLIVEKKGSWGEVEGAQVAGIETISHGGRSVAYLCRVEPDGFIVVSLRRELAPVKAYSSSGDFDPALEAGLEDLVKGRMARVLEQQEQRLRQEEAPTAEVLPELEIDYRPAWEELLQLNFAAEASDVNSGEAANYEEGEILMSSSWDQGDPYNRFTPAGSSCTHTRVGCVATAGAQIMYHWHWPPYGSGTPYSDTYDWPNMRDRVTSAAPIDQINAVAELSYEVGLAVNMDYGCSASSAYTYHMDDAMEDHFRYSTAAVRRNRDDYTTVEFYTRIKNQVNVNRPVQYKIDGHSIAGDGWQEIGTTPIRQVHMNYGWDNSYNTWYTLDSLHLGDPDNEYIIENIYPVVALGSAPTGTYSRQPFNYRYVDRDAFSAGATFSSGQNIQFLPGVVLTATGSTTSPVRMEANTRLFTRGDRSVGARIYSGVIKLSNNGGIRFE